MFLYMYENMAEFCLLGCDECRDAEPEKTSSRYTDSKQGMAHARQAREGSKPNRNPKTRVYWVGSNQQKTSQQTHGAPMGYGGKSRPPAPKKQAQRGDLGGDSGAGNGARKGRREDAGGGTPA